MGAIHGLRMRAYQSALRTALMTVVASKLQGEQLNPYYQLWDQHDANRDGTLNQEEFLSLCNDIGIGAQEAEDIFVIADAGNKKMVDFSEFVGVVFQPDILPRRELLALFRATFTTLADKPSGCMT